MGKKKDKRNKAEKLDRASTRSRSNTNVTTEADVTYYNIAPPSTSRASRSSHSNDGHMPTSSTATAHKPDTVRTSAPPSGTAGEAGRGGGGGETAISSSSSSSSSSTTTSDTDSLGPSQLALVPRPPGFNPYIMGFPPGQGVPPGYGAGMYGMQMGGYSPHYGGHPSMMGGGQLMLPTHGPGGQGSGFMQGALMPAGGMGPPPTRYNDHYDTERMAVLHQHPVASKHHHQHEPLIMEHPSLRQCVIFMAIMFVLALVALIVTAIYFGKTTETTWKI